MSTGGVGNSTNVYRAPIPTAAPAPQEVTLETKVAAPIPVETQVTVTKDGVSAGTGQAIAQNVNALSSDPLKAASKDLDALTRDILSQPAQPTMGVPAAGFLTPDRKVSYTQVMEHFQKAETKTDFQNMVGWAQVAKLEAWIQPLSNLSDSGNLEMGKRIASAFQDGKMTPAEYQQVLNAVRPGAASDLQVACQFARLGGIDKDLVSQVEKLATATPEVRKALLTAVDGQITHTDLMSALKHAKTRDDYALAGYFAKVGGQPTWSDSLAQAIKTGNHNLVELASKLGADGQLNRSEYLSVLRTARNPGEIKAAHNFARLGGLKESSAQLVEKVHTLMKDGTLSAKDVTSVFPLAQSSWDLKFLSTLCDQKGLKDWGAALGALAQGDNLELGRAIAKSLADGKINWSEFAGTLNIAKTEHDAHTASLFARLGSFPDEIRGMLDKPGVSPEVKQALSKAIEAPPQEAMGNLREALTKAISSSDVSAVMAASYLITHDLSFVQVVSGLYPAKMSPEVREHVIASLFNRDSGLSDLKAGIRAFSQKDELYALRDAAKHLGQGDLANALNAAYLSKSPIETLKLKLASHTT